MNYLSLSTPEGTVYIAKEPIEIGLEGDIYTEVLSQIDKTVVVGLNQDVELSEGFKAVVNSN